MRISDWSSDVCSSDLSHSRFQEVPFDEAGEWRVMHVWAVANQKGGVGKTTTAAALGGLLADRSARTLLVDMDPHGSLTTYLGFDADAAGAGVYALFRACVDEGQAAADESMMCKTAIAQLWLMQSSQSEGRRVGNECVSTCKSWWAQ